MDTQAPIIPSTTVYSSARAQDADGFSIRRALPIDALGQIGAEPFLQLEHYGPTTFGPTLVPHGQEKQAYRGLELVTLLYQGNLGYENSDNRAGQLLAGDVQWLTTGSGVYRAAKTGADITRDGGTIEMIQLWVNLPAEDKNLDANVRDLRADTFPVIPLSEAGTNVLRLVAGKWGSYVGPAKTHSPLTLADVYLDGLIETEITLAPEWATLVYVVRGGANINGVQTQAGEISLTQDEDVLTVSASPDTHLLFLSGLPLGESIASAGSIVMNTKAELILAEEDFRAGRV